MLSAQGRVLDMATETTQAPTLAPATTSAFLLSLPSPLPLPIPYHYAWLTPGTLVEWSGVSPSRQCIVVLYSPFYNQEIGGAWVCPVESIESGYLALKHMALCIELSPSTKVAKVGGVK